MAIAQYDAKKVKERKNINVVVGTERANYFDGIGKKVAKATDVETAVKLSGLDFEVVKYPISYKVEVPTTIGTSIVNHHDIPNNFATVRKDTGEALGIVTKGYEILQNQEAFDFLDSLAAEAKFETAGLYGRGARSFITMSTEPMKILGDEFKPYMLFTNSFDGSGSIGCMFTPIRVFCSNCLTRAIREAVNKIYIKHTRSMKDRLNASREILLGNTAYMAELKKEAENMAKMSYTSAQFKALVTARFGVDDNASELEKAKAEININALLEAYNQEDLQNFNNTVYKAVQAFADYESHRPAFRNTASLQYKNINTVMHGMPLTNSVASELMSAV